MKTKEELNALKNEVKDLNAKLAELSEDELKEVTGGVIDLSRDFEIENFKKRRNNDFLWNDDIEP